MNELVECVPNFSEGRNKSVVQAIAAEISHDRSIRLLDQEMNADHNRSVITFVGEPEAVLEAVLRGVRKATELIESLASADPNDTGHQRWLALTYFSNGNALALADQADKARERYHKAIAIDENLLAADAEEHGPEPILQGENSTGRTGDGNR